MMNDDELFKKMFESIDIVVEPPVGTKQRIYQRLFYEPCLSCSSKNVFKLLIQVWILICIFMSIFTSTIAF
ncbi:hypothetical protein [Clostridium estertheticum]|uniref:hypothetical protein n=1 Tax=Clostridium estertheticum TaxID=238834 RepID=UPI001CF10056|nr:hypothetical protein [Clostridium estertheticum]MCB2356998.1 hypothetical protein [Clostridium estertheticum]MCB2362180.1 hypothetical protein [Clostridium estertheticum]WAG43885.1 hypothetical protein LL065_25655 [Clostridium estertheticum]